MDHCAGPMAAGTVCRLLASTDADPINDDRAWRGQYRQILAGIILTGHQRGRLTGLVKGLAEETVPRGSRGLERGGWFESMPGQQRNLTGDGPGGVCPGQYGLALRTVRLTGRRIRCCAGRREPDSASRPDTIDF